MALTEALTPQCVAVGCSATSKDAVLAELATLMCASPTLAGHSPTQVAEELSRREAIASTGFTDGVAIPHCRLDKLDGFVVGLLTHPDGIDFGSLDSRPAHMFACIVGPADKRNEHVRLLSGISRVLSNPATVAELLAAPNAEVLHETFLRHAADRIESDDETTGSLFHVFVQKEELFEGILRVFSEIPGCSPTVLEAHDASEYLHRLPLFAGLWSEDRRGYHRVIMAVVGRDMANETLRRIRTSVGELKKRSGVAVTVQDLVYFAGNLEL